MSRQRTLLWMGLSVSALAAILGALNAPEWLRLWFGLPVVVLIPGYALVASMDPRGVLRGPERLALSIGASLSATVMLGLLISVSPAGLRPETWSAAISFFALLTSLLALHRTKGLRAVSERRAGLSADWRDVLVQSTIVLTMTATLAIALATAASAPIIGSEKAVEDGDASVMQLWVKPPEDGSEEMLVGIDNPGTRGFVCVLRVEHGRGRTQDRLLVMGPEESVSFTVQRDANASIMFPTEISLLGCDGSPLRQVSVWPPFGTENPGDEGDMKG